MALPTDSDTVRMSVALAVLEARVDREVERLGALSHEKALGTEHLGGVARVSGKLEAYLRTVVEWICVRERRDPRVEFDAVSGGKYRYGSATLGQLSILLGHLATFRIAADPASCRHLHRSATEDRICASRSQ